VRKKCLLPATAMMREAMERRQREIKGPGDEGGERKSKKGKRKAKEDAGEGRKMGEASGSRLEAAEEVVVVGEASGSQAGTAEAGGSQGEADFHERMLQMQRDQVTATVGVSRQLQMQTELMERLVRAVEEFVGKDKE